MADNQDYILDLAKLELGEHVFAFTLENDWLRAVEHTELLGGQAAATVRLRLRENDCDLHIAVKGSVRVTCDRCLDPLTLAVNVEDDVEIEEGAKTLDIRWLAYELIIVNLPLVHSHPEGECNPIMDKLLQAHLCSTVEEPDTK